MPDGDPRRRLCDPWRSPGYPGAVMLVLQISDPHIGGAHNADYKAVPTRASLRGVIALAKSQHWPPAAILVTGDLAMDGEAGAYAWLHDTFNGLGVPVYCLPGNHDALEPMCKLLPGANVSIPTSVALGAWQLECLNSKTPLGDHGELTGQTLQRLARRLQRRSERPTVVALHHHPLPSGSAWLDELNLHDANRLLELLDAHANVRGVVWGHVHQQFDGRRNGVSMLGCPSTCRQFKPDCEAFALDDRLPGYRWLELADDGNLTSGVSRLTSFQFNRQT